MEIKMFGKSLFKINRKEQYWGLVTSEVKTTKFLPNFYTLNVGSISITDAIALTPIPLSEVKPKKGKVVPVVPKVELTPKQVYQLKTLNDTTYKLDTNPAYVDEQIAHFKDKLNLISAEEYDMRRGINEISSIMLRMENRKKYGEVSTFFEEFPYTTTGKIGDLVKAHDYLKMGQVAEFLADMPKEAVEVMKNYNSYTNKVCGKQVVFYIIANKKDFQKTEKRRDPILLAQSPFAHMWQILGAWDEEMLIIDEL